MSDQQSSHEPQSMKIQLEVVPENAQEADIADIDEVGQSLVDELRNSGYMVNPTYTGKKGAPPFEILVPIAQFLHDNKDWLLAILSTVSPVLQFIQKERDRRAEKEKAKRDPLKLTLEVDDKVMTITSTPEDAAKLLEHFQTAHPEEAKEVSPQSNVKIKVHVPKKKSRHSH